ncbi:MAG: SPOR domain-containing protein [Gammaproteobacteria bacterium]|nr:SPOR domain-containing protein [Gammaproteobacteria bacterium]
MMRRIVLVLLLANLLLLAWYLLAGGRVAQQQGAADVAGRGQAAPPLTLLSELPAPPQAPEAQQQLSVPDERQSCYILKPFYERVTADPLAEMLNHLHGVQAEVVEVPYEWRSGYRVQIGPYRGYSAARDKLRELRQRKVTDLDIIRAGDRYFVSLGFFAKQGTMVERRQQITSLGYEVQVQEVFRRGTRYQLLLQLLPTVSIDEVKGHLTTAGVAAQQPAPVACDVSG